MKFDNFFNRWSVNILAISTPINFIILFFVLLHMMKVDAANFATGYGTAGIAGALEFIIVIYWSQVLILFIMIILLIKEFNPNFRIKNSFLLKICHNTFYRIVASIIAIFELIFMSLIFWFIYSSNLPVSLEQFSLI